jgi:hypothetical protein
MNNWGLKAKFARHTSLNFAASANEIIRIVDINNWGLKAKFARHSYAADKSGSA